MRILIVKAQDLRPGDRIITDSEGRIQTVAAPTELDQYGGCSIHTTESEILANLPCPVKLVQD
jgi:hypothetical protein